MDMKKVMVAAALIGSGLAAQAFAGGRANSSVTVGYSSGNPNLGIVFHLDNGARVDRHDAHERYYNHHDRHVPRGHAYGWWKKHAKRGWQCDYCKEHEHRRLRGFRG